MGLNLLFVVILLDLMGIGIMNPIFPFIGTGLGLTPGAITLVIAVYPIASFIAAPVWGRLSDKLGRRPILMISQAGAVAAYLILSFADNIWLLLLSRFVGGICAGNIGAAYAYISDVTTNENRAKGMAMIGAALSLGFIIGPMVGGLLAGSDPAAANFTRVALFCAVTNSLALAATIFLLPESLSAELREKIKNRPQMTRWQQFAKVRARTPLFLLFIAVLAFGTGGSVFESTFALWGAAAMNLGPRDVGLALSFAAVVLVAMQIAVVGRLAKRFGELPLVTAACVIYAIGLVLVATCTTWAQLLLAQVFLPVGLAIFNPNVSSLVSKQAAATERGVVMGFYASWGSLARGAGPLFSGTLLQASLKGPYAYGVGAMLATIGLIYLVRAQSPAPAAIAPKGTA